MSRTAREHGLDPILAVVAASTIEGPGRTVAFTASGLKEIAAALERRRTHADLPAALTAMVAFAAYLDRDCRSPKAAAALLAVAVTGLGAIEARVAHLRAERSPDDAALRKTRQLASFLGEVKEKRAPRLDAGRPRGTIGLSEVFRPRAITGR